MTPYHRNRNQLIAKVVYGRLLICPCDKLRAEMQGEPLCLQDWSMVCPQALVLMHATSRVYLKDIGHILGFHEVLLQVSANCTSSQYEKWLVCPSLMHSLAYRWSYLPYMHLF